MNIYLVHLSYLTSNGNEFKNDINLIDVTYKNIHKHFRIFLIVSFIIFSVFIKENLYSSNNSFLKMPNYHVIIHNDIKKLCNNLINNKETF